MNPDQSWGYRSKTLWHLARIFPGATRSLLIWSLRGYLPLAIYNHWLSKELEKALWPDGRPWVPRILPIADLNLEVDVGDYIGRRILEEGCYEPDTINFLRQRLKAGMNFIDIGANLGQYSVMASRLVMPGGTVHSFEPNPVVFSVLKRNLERNFCRNVVPNCAALGSKSGTATLFLSDARSLGTTSLTPADGYYSGRSVGIPVTTLDEYVATHSLERVDLIKIDVEGAELEVLQGATATLENNPAITVILEFNEGAAHRFGSSSAALEAFLAAQGFDLFLEDGRPLAEAGKPDEPYFNVFASRNRN